MIFKKLSLLLIFIICCSFFNLNSLFTKKTYEFTEETDGKKVNTSWTIKEKSKDIVIVGVNDNEIVKLEYKKDSHHLYKYTVTTHDNKTNFTITKDCQKLIIKGKTGGEKKENTVDIGSQIWIQQFQFGLKPFAKSDNSEEKFIIVNPKDFSTNELIAKKEDIETITVNKKEYKSQKLKITLPGFKGMFWTAHIWFNIENQDFLKYVGNDGPNTSTTTITFKK
jgi:hypothetical protein